METLQIPSWLLSTILFGLFFSSYTCFSLYREIKKKDRIIKLQEKIIDSMSCIFDEPKTDNHG